MSTVKITMDELRAELDSLHKIAGPKGFTAIEFEDAIGVSHSVAQLRLSKLVRQGQVKCVGRRKATRIDGRPSSPPVYALTTKHTK